MWLSCCDIVATQLKNMERDPGIGNKPFSKKDLKFLLLYLNIHRKELL